MRLRLYKKASETALTAADLDDVEIIFDANKTPASVTDEYAWASTGHAFVPADYEDRIVALEEDVNDNKVDVTLLKERVLHLENGEGAIIITRMVGR